MCVKKHVCEETCVYIHVHALYNINNNDTNSKSNNPIVYLCPPLHTYTQRLNYTVNKCVFPSSGSAAPGLPALLASELTVLEVLQAGGFCGSTDQLPPNAANGFVSVDVELRMQLPVDLKDTQITAAGVCCCWWWCVYWCWWCVFMLVVVYVWVGGWYWFGRGMRKLCVCRCMLVFA